MIRNRPFLVYMPIMAGASGLLFLRTFVYARVFPVESFGILAQALLIANTFASLAGIGIHHLAQKMLPQYQTVGDREAFDKLLSACVAVCAVSALIAGIALTVAIVLEWLPRSLVFVVVLPYAIAQYLFMVRLTEVRSELRFVEHSRLSAIRAAMLLCAGAATAMLTGNVAATLAVEGIVTLIVAAPLFLGAHGKAVLSMAMHVRTMHRWVADNYPAALRLFWLNGVATVLYSIDRWFGMVLLSEREFGIFAIGLIIITLFDTLQAIVNVSAMPLMGRMVARGDHRRAFRFATLASVVVIGGGFLCYIPFVLLLDFLLRSYLPSYVDAAGVIRWAVVVGILRLSDFYISFSVLLDQEWRLATGGCLLLALAVVSMSVVNALDIMHFNPDRMIHISAAIAVGVFALNFGIAAAASWRASRAALLDAAS